MLALPVFASIQVDQFGYPTSEQKIALIKQAVIGSDSLSEQLVPDDSASLVRYPDGTTVFKDAIESWNSGAVHDQSGDKVWKFDFSTIHESGHYQIMCGTQKSVPFEIRENPYLPVLKAAVKMFYYQRVNFAKEVKYASNWADGAAFEGKNQDRYCRSIFDSTNSSLVKDLHGGWFDAGDFNKYITFICGPVHQLLSAYQANPKVFTDDFAIPESGNDLPDLLDELKWELNWMLRMQNSDGSVIIKMGQSDYEGGTPPSSAEYSRFYGKTSTAAAIVLASTAAHASLVYREFPQWKAFADTLSIAAEKSFSYFTSSTDLDTNVDNDEVKSGDADWTEKEQRDEEVSAAIWLFGLTGKKSYNTHVIANSNNASALEWWGPYGAWRSDALFYYTSLPEADQSLKDHIETVKRSGSNSTFNCPAEPIDPWRLAIPDDQFHWGSNTVICENGQNVIDMDRVTLTDNVTHYRGKALDVIHFIHGRNPLGKVFLSNMSKWGAENSVDEMYHGWFEQKTKWQSVKKSEFGPAPGYIVGGINRSYSASSTWLPKNPTMKMYRDGGEGFPINSWEVTEPMCAYQGSYIRLLANFVNTSSDTVVASADPVNINFEEVTNSSKNVVTTQTIRGAVHFAGETVGTAKLYSIRGQELARVEGKQRGMIGLSLAKGAYLFSFETAGKRIVRQVLIR